MVRKNHTVLEGLPSILVNAAGGIMTTVGMTGWEQRKAGGGGGGDLRRRLRPATKLG